MTPLASSPGRGVALFCLVLPEPNNPFLKCSQWRMVLYVRRNKTASQLERDTARWSQGLNLLMNFSRMTSKAGHWKYAKAISEWHLANIHNLTLWNILLKSQLCNNTFSPFIDCQYTVLHLHQQPFYHIERRRNGTCIIHQVVFWLVVIKKTVFMKIASEIACWAICLK